MAAPKKIIVVTMPDGSRWCLAAEVVAHDRSNHYRDDGYQDEFNYAMGDSSELLDWAANNMNWEDVKTYARLYLEPKEMSDSDFQEGWTNGKKKVLLSVPDHLRDLPMPECK